MKTDKELLQLAAKAVGLRGMHERAGKLCYTMEHGGSVMWNPLDSDGDALRLAVDLGIGFMPDYEVCEVNTCYMIGRCGYNTNEEFGNDKHAATRRVIVRAAAAIGEGMNDDN